MYVRACVCEFVIYNVYNSEDRANIFILAQHTDIDNENENETLTKETKEKCYNLKCITPYKEEQRKGRKIAGRKEINTKTKLFGRKINVLV